jgi:WD40 repeat protein/serine/threonine protein kinase
LEIADGQDWVVKSLSRRNPGDILLGVYRIEDCLGEGGMGRVYVAEHQQWKVKVAIKAPNQMVLSNREHFRRILMEANAWVELGLHPHIAYCYFVREIEGVPHLIIEYVEGGNLRQWIEDGKCVDYRTNMDLAIQFCHALEYAHSKGKIHRDISPENVLMTTEGVLKITDFGLVRSEDIAGDVPDGSGAELEDARKTRLGTFMGKEGYLAPEQARDAGTVDVRADLFAMGVCFYEIFCGNQPYGNMTHGARKEAPDPVRLSHDPKFPKDLAILLQRCVQWNRDDRYASAKEVRAELVRIYRKLFGEESPYAECDLLDVEADGLTNQGVSYHELGRPIDAEACFQKALERDGTHLQATFNLGLLQWRSGRINDDELILRLKNCLHVRPKDEDICRRLLARVHVERLQPELAIELLKERPKGLHDVVDDVKVPLIRQVRCKTLQGHASYVNSVGFSPDGRWLVSGSEDRSLRLWDVSRASCSATFEGAIDRVTSVSFGFDGRWVLFGCRDGSVRVWDIERGECIACFTGHTYYVTSVSFSPDGKYAASGSVDTSVRLWRVKGGLRTGCRATLTGHGRDIISVSFSPDGKWLASGSLDRTVRLWDLSQRTCVAILKGHTGGITSVSYSPDGKWLASGSEDETIKFWDVEQHTCVASFNAHTAGVKAVAFSTDGRWVVSGGEDKTVRLWDIERQSCLATRRVHTGKVTTVAISPDGNWIASGGEDKSVQLWDIHTGIFHAKMELCRARGLKDLRVARAKRKSTLSSVDRLISSAQYQGAFSQLIMFWRAKGFDNDEEFARRYRYLWSRGRPSERMILTQREECRFDEKPFGITDVRCSPTGKLTALGSEDMTVQVWDSDKNACLASHGIHKGRVSCVEFSADGRRVVSGDMDDCVYVWDLEKGEFETKLTGRTGGVMALSFSPNGRQLALRGHLGGVWLWDLAQHICFPIAEGNDDWAKSVPVVFSPDGKLLAWGGDGKIVQLWDVLEGHLLAAFKGHTDGITCLAFSPDGKLMASGSSDQTIHIWQVDLRAWLLTLKGHTGAVSSLAFSPDGSLLASGSDDTTVRLWDVARRTSVETFDGHKGRVKYVTFSLDGHHLLSLSDKGALLKWRLLRDLEFPVKVDWDKSVQPYLDMFLYRHQGVWTADDLRSLLHDLAHHRGLGWVREQGIREELLKMTAGWRAFAAADDV